MFANTVVETTDFSKEEGRPVKVIEKSVFQ